MAKGKKDPLEKASGPKKNVGQIISDPRFAAVHSDPRFQRFPKAHRKVDVDERFAGMFKDKSFEVRSAVDKRGRQLGRGRKNEDMRKYYRLANEEEDWGKGSQAPEELAAPKAGMPAELAITGEETWAESSSSSEEEEGAQEDLWARARGLAGPQSSGDSSGSGSEPDSDEDDESLGAPEVISEEEEAQAWGVGAMAANPDERIPTSEETSRLAIVDLDWSKVRAVDILALLASFCRKGQAIHKVTVYPSDFGLERMEEEAALGPLGHLRDVAAADHNGGDGLQDAEAAVLEDGEEEADGGSGSDRELGSDALDGDSSPPGNGREEEESGDEAVAQRRLQMYERSRLRYYYAVVDCADVATAACLYAECDGMEFDHSALRLDLRFVPEGQSFEGRAVRDKAGSVPADYRAPQLAAAGMLHTRAKLTWDAEDEGRQRALTKRLTKDQIRDEDFKAYLGSDSDGEEEGATGGAEQLRALLDGDAAAARTGGKAWGAVEGEDAAAATGPPVGRRADKDMELEVTFEPGLDSLTERLQAKKQAAADGRADTVWAAYLRRRREKREEAKRRGRRAGSSSDDDDDDEDDDGAPATPADEAEDPFDDPFFKAGKAKRRTTRVQEDLEASAGAEAARRRAELEMLLLDDSALQDAARLGVVPAMAEEQGRSPVAEQEPGRKKKGLKKAQLLRAARQQERQAGSDDEDLPGRQDGFRVNLHDDRFGALFTDAKYALDPTDPRFAASKSSEAVLSEASRRRRTKGVRLLTAEAVPLQAAQGRADVQLKQMVAALKRKAGASAGALSKRGKA